MARAAAALALRLHPLARLGLLAGDLLSGGWDDPWVVLRPGQEPWDGGYRWQDFGFVKCCETEPPPYTHVHAAGGNQNPAPPCAQSANCGLPLQYSNRNYGDPISFPNGGAIVFLGRGRSNGQMTFMQKWAKNQTGSPITVPYSPPVPATPPVVAPAPAVVPPPIALPPDGGYGPPAPRAKPDPRLKPWQSKATQYPGAVPVAHSNEPPGPTKERKTNLGGNAGLQAAAGFYGGITEAADLADALAEGLPGNMCKTGGLHERFACLYDNFEAIDLPKALAAIIGNQVTDAAIGAFGQAVKKGTKAASQNGYYAGGFGLGAGGRFRPKPPSL